MAFSFLVHEDMVGSEHACGMQCLDCVDHNPLRQTFHSGLLPTMQWSDAYGRRFNCRLVERKSRHFCILARLLLLATKVGMTFHYHDEKT